MSDKINHRVPTAGIARATLSEREKMVLNRFVDTGEKVVSYKTIYPTVNISDANIIKWFTTPEVCHELLNIQQSMVIYDTVCDAKLLQIINDPATCARDCINAIKEWNSLRSRILTQVQVNTVSEINFKNIDSDNMEILIGVILKGREDINELQYIENKDVDK